MNFGQTLHSLQDISRLAHLIAANDEPMPPADRVDVFIVLDGVVNDLRDIHAAMRHEAMIAAAELGVGVGMQHHGAFGTVVRMRTRKAKEHWEGHALLGALSQLMADENGEVREAVPVSTLREVLPACSKPGLTSSKWLRSGLARIGFPADHYCKAEVEWVEHLDVLHVDVARDELLEAD